MLISLIEEIDFEMDYEIDLFIAAHVHLRNQSFITTNTFFFLERKLDSQDNKIK